MCPDLGHSWFSHGLSVESEGKYVGTIRRDLACVNCGTERVDRLRYDGSVMARNYKYEGYREQLALFGQRHDRVARVRAALIAVTVEKPSVRLVRRRAS